MKKLSFFSLPFFIALFIVGCQKEQITPSASSIEVNSLQTVTNMTNEDDGTTIGRYFHNGLEIDPNLINWDDDNVEMYYNFGTEDDIILVFYNNEEVETWLNTLGTEQAELIRKRRLFRQQAINIAIETGIENYYSQNGTTSEEYNTTINNLYNSIFREENNLDRGIGLLYDHTLFSGTTSPILGIGFGKPFLGSLDQAVGSTKCASLSAVYGYHTKMFYRGAWLNVNCMFQNAAISSGNFNVGNACGFDLGLSYVTFTQTGALRLWDNKTRSFFPSFG